MFFRTGGLSKKLFQKSIDQYCQVVEYKKGAKIPLDDLIDDENNNRKWFYIIYQGQVQLTVVAMESANQGDAWKQSNHGKSKIVNSTTRIAQSGQIFDFRSLGFLKDSTTIAAQNEQHKHKLNSAKALSEKVVLFRFPAKLMATKIACDPTTKLMWKELLMENLLRIVQRHFYKTRREQIESRNSNMPMVGHGHHGIAADAINPIFWPLEKWEEPDALCAGSGKALRRPFWHIVKSMQWSFTPPWPFLGFPMGLRHKQYLQPPAPPADGIMDQTSSAEAAMNGDAYDAEKQPLSPEGSVGYSSVESFRQEDDFLEYLDEMDEETGLGLNISFIAADRSDSMID
jgi:hypothetical protein